ncbi:hypothetical protein [Nocardioides mangrovi]|uniref:Uncharacterized protein n=1 Tax=Nocardioides mangrovi TaxID=2874580 RepID=A0ABS7UJQ1_9ACTN|nr:hypothetical protein [Nocardioides mangrovi]MBZ5741250.1 hypothetical protein [Nocardioides mangrovi]
MTTDEQQQFESEADARTARASVRARHLAELMERRPDLFGVHPAADLVADSVRWTA